MQTLSRAWAGLNLTPGERAFLKLLEGWLFTAVGVGFAAGYQLLMFGNADYAFIVRSAGGAALLTLFLSLKKYLSSQSDLPLPEKVVAQTVVDAAVNQVQKAVPPAQPQQQFVQVPQMGSINLANIPIPNAPGTRRFGDTGIVPIPPVGQPQ